MLHNPPLHHVGIVQPDEESAVALMQLLGLREAYRGYVPQFHALCIFTESPVGSPVEFVVPDGGRLQSFNKGAGGLHHIAFEVPDLRELMRSFQAEGIEMLEPEPVKGAGDFICNFLRPAATRGIITEFVQRI